MREQRGVRGRAALGHSFGPLALALEPASPKIVTSRNPKVQPFTSLGVGDAQTSSWDKDPQLGARLKPALTETYLGAALP